MICLTGKASDDDNALILIYFDFCIVYMTSVFISSRNIKKHHGTKTLVCENFLKLR